MPATHLLRRRRLEQPAANPSRDRLPVALDCQVAIAAPAGLPSEARHPEIHSRSRPALSDTPSWLLNGWHVRHARNLTRNRHKTATCITPR